MVNSKILSVEAIPVKLPFRERVCDSWGEYYASNHGIVIVTADDGTKGIGEISFAWFGGAHSLCREVNEIWANRLIGHEIFQILPMISIMDELCVFSRRHLIAKAGVEMALWDLMGKELGVSVSRLLGGRLRESIPLTGGIPMSEPDEAAEVARQRIRQGYRELKLKVGLDDARDIEMVRAVRNAIPSEVRLRADANMAWRDRKRAVRMMEALWDLGVDLIEQPLDEHDYEGLSWLRGRVKNRILIDEGVWDIHDAKMIIEHGAADILHLYTCEAGGIESMRNISRYAMLHGIPCTIGSMPEGCIGAAASAQVACAMENLAADASDIRGFTVYEQDVVKNRLNIVDGALIVPDLPGLGVELDADRLNALRVK